MRSWRENAFFAAGFLGLTASLCFLTGKTLGFEPQTFVHSFFEPRIEILPTEVRIDSAVVGQPVTAQFTIFNRGRSTLDVFGHTASCDCTVADLDTVQIPAGKGHPFNLSFTPRSAVYHRQVVQIHSNDPKRPTISVAIAANVSVAKPTVVGSE
jgi:hypothetical protein